MSFVTFNDIFNSAEKVSTNEWFKCEYLSPLEKLWSLKHWSYSIWQMQKKVGNEFLGIELEIYGRSITFTIVIFSKIENF